MSDIFPFLCWGRPGHQVDERVQHRDLWGNSAVSQSQTQMSRVPVLLPRPGLGIMGSECLCFDPHTNNLFLSVALNYLATPSSLTKTLKWLFFWLDCRYLKIFQLCFLFPSLILVPSVFRLRQGYSPNMRDTEHRRNIAAFGSCWSCHERLCQVGLNRHSLDLMDGSGQPEAMLPGDLPTV